MQLCVSTRTNCLLLNCQKEWTLGQKQAIQSPNYTWVLNFFLHSKVILSSKKDSPHSLLLSETKLSVENFSGEQRARLNSLQSNSPLALIVLGVKSSAERGGLGKLWSLPVLLNLELGLFKTLETLKTSY